MSQIKVENVVEVGAVYRLLLPFDVREVYYPDLMRFHQQLNIDQPLGQLAVPDPNPNTTLDKSKKYYRILFRIWVCFMFNINILPADAEPSLSVNLSQIDIAIRSALPETLVQYFKTLGEEFINLMMAKKNELVSPKVVESVLLFLEVYSFLKYPQAFTLVSFSALQTGLQEVLVKGVGFNCLKFLTPEIKEQIEAFEKTKVVTPWTEQVLQSPPDTPAQGMEPLRLVIRATAADASAGTTQSQVSTVVQHPIRVFECDGACDSLNCFLANKSDFDTTVSMVKVVTQFEMCQRYRPCFGVFTGLRLNRNNFIEGFGFNRDDTFFKGLIDYFVYSTFNKPDIPQLQFSYTFVSVVMACISETACQLIPSPHYRTVMSLPVQFFGPLPNKKGVVNYRIANRFDDQVVAEIKKIFAYMAYHLQCGSFSTIFMSSLNLNSFKTQRTGFVKAFHNDACIYYDKKRFTGEGASLSLLSYENIESGSTAAGVASPLFNQSAFDVMKERQETYAVVRLNFDPFSYTVSPRKLKLKLPLEEETMSCFTDAVEYLKESLRKSLISIKIFTDKCNSEQIPMLCEFASLDLIAQDWKKFKDKSAASAQVSPVEKINFELTLYRILTYFSQIEKKLNEVGVNIDNHTIALVGVFCRHPTEPIIKNITIDRKKLEDNCKRLLLLQPQPPSGAAVVSLKKQQQEAAAAAEAKKTAEEEAKAAAEAKSAAEAEELKKKQTRQAQEQIRYVTRLVFTPQEFDSYPDNKDLLVYKNPNILFTNAIDIILNTKRIEAAKQKEAAAAEAAAAAKAAEEALKKKQAEEAAAEAALQKQQAEAALQKQQAEEAAAAAAAEAAAAAAAEAAAAAAAAEAIRPIVEATMAQVKDDNQSLIGRGCVLFKREINSILSEYRVAELRRGNGSQEFTEFENLVLFTLAYLNASLNTDVVRISIVGTTGLLMNVTNPNMTTTCCIQKSDLDSLLEIDTSMSSETEIIANILKNILVGLFQMNRMNMTNFIPQAQVGEIFDRLLRYAPVNSFTVTKARNADNTFKFFAKNTQSNISGFLDFTYKSHPLSQFPRKVYAVGGGGEPLFHPSIEQLYDEAYNITVKYVTELNRVLSDFFERRTQPQQQIEKAYANNMTFILKFGMKSLQMKMLLKLLSQQEGEHPDGFPNIKAFYDYAENDGGIHPIIIRCVNHFHNMPPCEFFKNFAGIRKNVPMSRKFLVPQYRVNSSNPQHKVYYDINNTLLGFYNGYKFTTVNVDEENEEQVWRSPLKSNGGRSIRRMRSIPSKITTKKMKKITTKKKRRQTRKTRKTRQTRQIRKTKQTKQTRKTRTK